MTDEQLAILNSLVTFAAENVPGGLNEREREVAKMVGRWTLWGTESPRQGNRMLPDDATVNEICSACQIGDHEKHVNVSYIPGLIRGTNIPVICRCRGECEIKLPFDSTNAFRISDHNGQPAGVWAAFFSDWSDVVIFTEEIQALRYAVNNGMRVGFWEFNTSLKAMKFSMLE